MPNANHVRIPSYRKHKASGQAVVTMDGRDRYLGRHGTAVSKAAYNLLVAEWLAAGCQVPRENSTITMNEIILGYWRHAEDYYRTSPGEMERIKQAVRPLKELYGSSRATAFGPLSLKAVRQRMIESGLARKTINFRIGTIKRLIKWATENELIPAAVFHGVQAVDGLRYGRSDAKETAPVKPAPQAHVDAVLPFVSKPVGAMIQLQLLTAMRPGEVCRIRGIDLEVIGRVWVYHPPAHKPPATTRVSSALNDAE